MARTEIELAVRPSLLDRLTDEAPDTPADPPQGREETLRAFRAAVQRDVESLLNTRRTMYPAPAHCPETRASVYEYGLPDTTGVAIVTQAGRDGLTESLRDALARFEPRLGTPRVRLLDAEQGQAPQVRFVVEAILRVDPNPERVVFDTVLQVASGTYDVGDGPGTASDASAASAG